MDPCFRTSLPRFLLPGSCYSFLFLIILDAPSQSALNRTLLFAAYKHSLLRRALTVLRVIAESSAVGCFSPLMKGTKEGEGACVPHRMRSMVEKGEYERGRQLNCH